MIAYLDTVVNCFKMCIFAVASTIEICAEPFNLGCELLQNVYLCSSKHNLTVAMAAAADVVNCFKMCIFAVASTITILNSRSFSCCELLQNVYLCSSKHNIAGLYVRGGAL